MKYTILVAEDNFDIRNILKLYLEGSEYSVIEAEDGEQALECIERKKIDLAVVDIMMPKMDGYSLIKRIREKFTIPIIILSAKIEDNDKILGLNLGADDYMTKPFNPLEIVARIKANLRRFYELNAAIKESSIIRVGELELDTDKWMLKKNGKEIILTPNEYKILLLLMKSPGSVFSKAQICETMNGEVYENYESVIAVHIAHLRDKIENESRHPQYIKTVRGLGYIIEKA